MPASIVSSLVGDKRAKILSFFDTIKVYTVLGDHRSRPILGDNSGSRDMSPTPEESGGP
jgi:hypothetical protein